MPSSIPDKVIDFYETLFDRIFSDSFRSRISERLKRNVVLRQVEEAADAASQSLTRFFLNERLNEQQVTHLLDGFVTLDDRLELSDIANPNISPEAQVEALLVEMPCPEAVRQASHDVAYRVALHSVVQVLMQVGPVMAEWQKLSFASTFELPRRVVNRLNQISKQLDALGRAGQETADEAYELTHRDYLLQRFHRVEAGTVRMTTNLDVDLRELFVMPRVFVRSSSRGKQNAESTDEMALMDLAAARAIFVLNGESEGRVPNNQEKEKNSLFALDQVKRYPRNVIIGVPGSGKSTFLEWLQVKLAAVEEELVMAGSQAIPLLLRIRQLDPYNLPYGAALIEKATASKDRATLIPFGWIDRQMQAGRVLLMFDGLDEVEPALRDGYVLPWLRELCQQYPYCRYLVSSRPVGYPDGILRQLEFVECDLLDFTEPQISEYTRHWCTAVRLARNEPEEEARREGEVDGARIVEGFKGHPYIPNLARNPLMLSAICLVNYFEGGNLPKDRAVLYRLCVEGLLHHWDQRRGIHSEFALEEKLRVCREVALSMQADDRAEYAADKIQQAFATVLGDEARAKQLLEHIRYRTGLLLERRPNIFAFAHLTFQEYLAARAIYEGNRRGVTVDQLIREHNDGRWNEVIALYCGLAPTSAAKEVIERLVVQPDSPSLSSVLSEAYLSAGFELSQDLALRKEILQRVARAPISRGLELSLNQFPLQEVTPVANLFVGRIESDFTTSEAFWWLSDHPEHIDFGKLATRLSAYPNNPEARKAMRAQAKWRNAR